MSADRCTRAWQAEALEDGRLAPEDAASFERHAATCETCRAELAALGQLKAVAERMPVLTSTSLEHRRLRQDLLRRAHEASVRPARSPRLAWLAAITATVCAIAFIVLIHSPASAPVPVPAIPAADPAPDYQATASPDAVWHTRERGRVLRLALERGQLELTVAHLMPGQRFIVQLPDGELEVKGTRFVVRADDGRTTSVRVIDGRVALRLNDRPDALLAAGDSFAAPSVAPVQAPEPDLQPSRPQPRATAQPKPSPEPSGEAASIESTFARAMSAFQAGDFGHADTLFEQFEREHPDDSRVEDAVFLRAVGRARRGDGDGARALARDYLGRFPNGLRKADAERLAR